MEMVMGERVRRFLFIFSMGVIVGGDNSERVVVRGVQNQVKCDQFTKIKAFNLHGKLNIEVSGR